MPVAAVMFALKVFVPRAQAGTVAAGDCPGGAHEAAGDSGWAADRIASISHPDVNAVMVINNSRGVCADSPQSCATIVQALLPPGATLYVWSPGRDVPARLMGGP